MPEPTEFEDQNGDLWIVRECEADEDCVAVEKWWPPNGAPNRRRDEEPPRPGYRKAADFHIPLASLGDMIDALRTFDRQAGAHNA